MSSQKTDTIAVKCVADGRIELITNAVMKEWKQCNTCSYIICRECIAEYITYSGNSGATPCPGSSFQRTVHNMELIEIRFDEILKIAQKKQIRPATGVLIQKAFYHPSKLATLAPEVLDDNIILQLSTEPTGNISIRQEQWSNMGSVIVKRNRGKYVMWEQLERY
jgi:hypothetical protein